MTPRERLDQNKAVALKLATMINNVYPQEDNVLTARIKTKRVEVNKFKKSITMSNYEKIDDINDMMEKVQENQNCLLFANKEISISDIDIDYLLHEKITFEFDFQTLINIKEVIDSFRPEDYKSEHPLI